MDINLLNIKMAGTNKIIFGKTFENFGKEFHNHLNLLDGNKLLKGGLIK